ncbi:biorientation of chromosomes in cell division protein 1-like 1 [Pectinophora gossypiella]|uniref:biorientation of chromosomes in cell division protein 1-like 1 n=1 Tax=Pectinophora gossypiella TaxID=13191 RepID=UPI00214F33A2|nr:biorientation of chromosomes in cell division protein 1-like 1 [Pectinophora gossypiella]
MAHLQYMPGDPRLVDQLVCELKSKGIFDQFRKECIADVDTRPAYQNLRQRVESSVATFLSRQIWKPDLNKNQLREKLRKHLLDGNYLEQGVERIVDQVVNPKVASVFIPQVEDLVYNYLGIPRKKTAGPETSNGKPEDLLPTDLEAVSPGSVKSHDEKDMDISDDKEDKMEIDDDKPKEVKDDSITFESIEKEKEESRLSGISELTLHDSDVSIDKSTTTIPLPAEEIKLENIPAPENSPPNIKNKNIDLEKIDLPKEPDLSTDIPLPDEIPKTETDAYFKPIQSEDDDSSSDSSVRRNVSPLTPIRNFNNENSCDAQQAFENDEFKDDDKKEPSTFRFTIESKADECIADEVKIEKKEEAPFQFNAQANLNTFNTPLYDDSSNSNNLQIDYESDTNSKATELKPPEPDQNSGDSNRKEKKDEKKSSHKSSHRSRDSSRHSSSKDKRSESKHSKDSSRDSSRHDKKSKDDKAKSSSKEKSSEKSDKKDSRDSSKHRSSSSYKSSSHKDSKHKSSSSSKHSSKDDRKSSSSSQREKEKGSDKSDKSERSKDKTRDSKSSSSKDKDRKSSSSKKSDEKENKEKKEKKETDDHYSLSGRGNPNRRSTDRDSNDGSSSSKGSHRPSHSKSSGSKKDGKGSSKSDNTSTSGDSASPSDAVEVNTAKNGSQNKPIRVDTHLGNRVATPPRLPFVPDVTIKKPKFAANLEEAKQKMKMRKFLEEEQKRMNQEAALLLEFQANVRPSLSQVYSSIPGPELEFACVSNSVQPTHSQVIVLDEPSQNNTEDTKTFIKEEINRKDDVKVEYVEEKDDEIAKTLIAMHEDGSSNQELEFTEIKIEDTINIVIERLPDAEEIDDEKVETGEMSNKDIASEEESTIEVEAKKEKPICYEITVITEEMFDTDESQTSTPKFEVKSDEKSFHYFAEHEKYDAEIERNKFTDFFKRFTDNMSTSKMYLVNCDTYEENLMKEVSQTYGDYEIVNYYKNSQVRVPKTSKNIVKNVNVAEEITLPTHNTIASPVTPRYSPIFSPVKSECSFDLSSDYDNKLEEMVNKTSRQEIMEIILGGVIDDSLSEMPQIDYCMDSNIEDNGLKRKITDVESTNNNRQILTPNKMRKLSGSDQISSTTEESDETPTNTKVQNNIRSKYLGKAKRVGLPRPKKTTLPNSPSSDKSVENYEQNEAPTQNGKLKNVPRSKVQRYDTSDLYKPKLHYLSRRNNIA